MENKYCDIQMIECDPVEDIVYNYIDHLYDTDKTIGLVACRELVEYTLDEVMKLDETSINCVDFRCESDEYIISVNNNGAVTVQNLENYDAMNDCDILYISMDGDVAQDVIDFAVNEDKEVILFGEADVECECIEDENCNRLYVHKDSNGIPLGFTKTWGFTEDGVCSYSSYSHYSDDVESLKEIASIFDVIL